MTSPDVMSLPWVFCWTRFGVEAGQDVEAILQRKEVERRTNGGVFLWGVGNSVLPSLDALLAADPQPRAVFSPIRSRPRPTDAAPSRLAVWTRARVAGGGVWRLPSSSLVTSHADGVLRRHYALVCRAAKPLRLVREGETFRSDSLYNLRTGRPVGFSQVTAIVQRRDEKEALEHHGTVYTAAMIVDLVPPYAVALEAPVVMPVQGRDSDTLIGACWEARQRVEGNPIGQLDLFA